MVFLLVFASGSQRYNLSPDKSLVIIFGLVLLLWLAYSDRRISDRFFLYTIVFASFLFIIHLYTDGSLSIPSVIGTTMKLVMAYLVLRVVGSEFVDTYIRIIAFIALVSLVGYLIDRTGALGGFTRALPRIGVTGHDGFLYIFGFRKHIDRNSSLFFEPGAYQIYLNSALFLILFVKTSLSAGKQWAYIVLLLVTLLTTFSTTGFLMFAVMFGLFLAKSSILSAGGKTALAGLLLVVGVMFAAQFQQVVLEKVVDYVDVADITDSSNLRSFDMLVDMEIFKRHIFGVGYDEYVKLVSAIGLVREGQVSSNGVTRVLATYGLPFALFLFGSYFLAIKKMLGGILLPVVAFGLLLMFFVGESYFVFSPFCLLIIAGVFVFRRDKVLSEHKLSLAEGS